MPATVISPFRRFTLMLPLPATSRFSHQRYAVATLLDAASHYRTYAMPPALLTLFADAYYYT